MCERECLCNICRFGPCGNCKKSMGGMNLVACRSGGIKKCKGFKLSIIQWIYKIINGGNK